MIFEAGQFCKFKSDQRSFLRPPLKASQDIKYILPKIEKVFTCKDHYKQVLQVKVHNELFDVSGTKDTRNGRTLPAKVTTIHTHQNFAPVIDSTL